MFKLLKRSSQGSLYLESMGLWLLYEHLLYKALLWQPKVEGETHIQVQTQYNCENKWIYKVPHT